jgi:hypothetical protein
MPARASAAGAASASPQPPDRRQGELGVGRPHAARLEAKPSVLAGRRALEPARVAVGAIWIGRHSEFTAARPDLLGRDAKAARQIGVW